MPAEFISVMKTVQNPTVFMKTQKYKKIIDFSSLFEVFTETPEQIATKSHKILFLDGKEDK